MRKISPKVWHQYVEGRGFFCGYAQIGLDMLRIAVNNPRVIQAVRCRKENQQKFNHEYYLRNTDRISQYKREWRARRKAAG